MNCQVKSQKNYAVKVSNRFEVLGAVEEERSPDELWKETREILLDVAEVTVGLNTPGGKLGFLMTHVVLQVAD